ncbi:MAG: hypothetical protein CMI59_01760 [Parvibaculum sp.]|nr:hypothetical protein [Parvibaculum sp.]
MRGIRGLKQHVTRGGTNKIRHELGAAILLPATLLAGLAFGTVPASAQDARPQSEIVKNERFPDSGEVLMLADELDYDRNAQIVTARGNVELAYGKRVLIADKVVYDEKADIVTADGNVALLDPGGDVAFADHLVLRNKMKDGVVTTLRILMANNAKLAGNDVVRKDANITTLHKGVYSPCDVCAEKGQTEPLWQIKAFRVTHNKEEQRIVYEDARMELFGVPILYTPYFSMADPSVKRKSGFLSPSFANSNDLGQQIETPYFWAIAPDKDFTFSPRFTTRQGIIYKGTYRELFSNGRMTLNGTGTWPRDKTLGTPGDKNFRGSFFGNGSFRLNDHWSWSFRSELTTDETYLRKYDLSGATDLVNNLSVDYANGRNWFSSDLYAFRGLLASDNYDTTPWIAPHMKGSYTLPSKVLGGMVSFSGDALILGRNDGPNMRRLSTRMDWNLRRTTVGGLVYRLFANLRGDLYSVENVKDPSNPAVTFSDTTLFRGLPTMGTEVSYPLVRYSGGLREVLEPILQLIYSPDIGNTVELPNEDSLSFEFDDTNLFSENRFPGLDRWETGTRLNAGMRYSLFWGPQGRASALIGQSFRLNENQSFSSASGLRNELSDVVGRIMVSPSSNWLIVHRFRVGSESFKLRRNEVNAYGRYGPVSAQLGYAYFAADQFSTFTPREEIVLGSVVRLDDYWRLFGQTRRDLSKHRAVNNSVGVGYSDECLDISLGYYQSFTRDRDIEPENSFILRLTLKTLGSTDG